MLSRTAAALRYRTAWRELLHPLPVRARQMEWLKRDTVEQNEALLRRPYYTIKSSAAATETTETTATTSAENKTIRAEETIRSTIAPERLRELRAEMRFPGAVGPMPQSLGFSSDSEKGPQSRGSYAEDYGDRLRPRYPESWETVPPHQPSRNPL